MTKEQKNTILEEMKRTIKNYRDAEKNADGFYSKESIENNMAQYFTGLQYTMELLTGLEWHWSYDGINYSVVSIDKKGKEIYYKI
jgi:hypothetical protein